MLQTHIDTYKYWDKNTGKNNWKITISSCQSASHTRLLRVMIDPRGVQNTDRIFIVYVYNYNSETCGR